MDARRRPAEPAERLRIMQPCRTPSGAGARTVDNLAIARLLGEIADLLEIKAENPFKIRAYRNASDSVAAAAERLADLDEPRLLQIPGIGRDLAKKVREIAETGGAEYHRELLAEFPPTLLDLMRLQGVGPRTVRQLHAELGINTLDDLEAALQDGRIRQIRGMGARKQEAMLKALADHRRHAGRHLMTDTAETAAALLTLLREQEPDVQFIPVGSLRRGCETCGDLDVLAIGAPTAVMDRFTTYGLVERVLGRGETKSSVLLRGGQQADLRLVPAASRGAAMQYFTGSKAHNIALRDRALRLGFKLNEYGLFRMSDNERIAGETEEGIYAALGLPWIPPELREAHGELEAAEQGALPALIDRRDLRGDLHAHTTATDGRDGIEAMALAARDAGLEYLAITDHSQALAMANGLDERRALEHASRVREVSTRLDGIALLAGIECDIRADGTLDLAARLPRRARLRRRLHPLVVRAERGRNDRPPAAGDGVPVGRHPRAPDRTDSAAARAAQGAAGPDCRRRCPVGCGTRDQLPG